MTVSESQPSDETISRFLSMCKVYSGVDTQVLLTTAEPSTEDKAVGSSVRSTTCSTTGLARPQLHTLRFAESFATSRSEVLPAVRQLSTEMDGSPLIAVNCPFA